MRSIPHLGQAGGSLEQFAVYQISMFCLVIYQPSGAYSWPRHMERDMARKNLRTSLRKRSEARPMDVFDELPVELRRWLAHAALPWSSRSAWRIWRNISCGGGNDVAESYELLDAIERRMLRRDATRIWGEGYPED